MDTDSASLDNTATVTNSAGQQAAGVPGYDAAGDVTSDGPNTYLYDAEGRVCAVENTPMPGTSSMTGYIYDAEGRRVAKGTITTMSCDLATNGFQVTTTYVLDQGGQELTQLDGSGAWQRTNVYGAGQLLATYDANGLHFHISDPLGTRRMQVSGDNNMLGQPETDLLSLPYGDGLRSNPDPDAAPSADDATPLHFTGKERDAETGEENGNDYFGARYYASSMGRFLSPDWSAKVEPVPYAKLDDPQTLNLYSYVQNNPLMRADADGHCYPLCTVAIGAAVGFVAGAGAEYISEKLKGEKVDSSKILHAGEGGALAGAITGLAGPEAELPVKLGTSVGAQVIGGAVDRKLNGEKVLDVKAGTKDAVAGLVGAKIDGAAERTFDSTFLKKTVPAATEAIIDAGQRGSGSEAKPTSPPPPPPPTSCGPNNYCK